MGNTAEAEQNLHRSIDDDPNYVGSYVIVAQIYMGQKRLPEARSKLESVIAKRPDAVGAPKRVAMLLPQASAMERLCRKYSALSLPPTTASRLPRTGGVQNSGLAAFAEVESIRSAMLMEVPTSGGRSNSPEIA